MKRNIVLAPNMPNSADAIKPYLEAAERGQVHEICLVRPGRRGVHVVFFCTGEAAEALEMVKRHIRGILDN